MDIIAGTFSKSLASIGGFVTASASVINFLGTTARPLIFTASLPPSNTAGVLAALEVLRTDTERREVALGQYPAAAGASAASASIPGRPRRRSSHPDRAAGQDTGHVAEGVRRGGLHQSGVPPAVPPSQCRLRTSVMATHTADQIDYCVETIGKIGKELGVI